MYIIIIIIITLSLSEQILDITALAIHESF